MIDLNELKKLAEAVPEFPWEVTGHTVYALEHDGWRKGIEKMRNRFSFFVQRGPETPESELQAIAEFCQAANPAAVLELIAMAIAAAPQVVADEPIGYINPEFLTERRNEFEQNGTVMFAWQCGECTSPIYGAAAPVQAQEPVPEAARQNGGLVRAALIDLMVLERQATSACDGFKAQRDCNLRFARARKALADSADTALVQPVAVPDGPYTFPIGEDGEYMILDKDGRQVGTVLYYHHAKAIAAALAAPAAQGDAKDAELARIKRLATCGTVDSFLLLPEQDKRYWFAMAWQESDLRKLAEERIAFLHSTNKDADDYEFGIAKVKFDAAGKIESFLWALSDNSDLDAAIAAKAAS